jgi:hypothetical protein
MVEHPESPQGVFHEVPDNPVGCKKLGGSRDVLGRDLPVFFEPFEDFVLFLQDVELIEPTDDFHIAATLFGKDFPEGRKNGTLAEKIPGHEKFCVIIDTLEHGGHDWVIPVAGCYEQKPIGFLLGVRRRNTAVQ